MNRVVLATVAVILSTLVATLWVGAPTTAESPPPGIEGNVTVVNAPEDPVPVSLEGKTTIDGTVQAKQSGAWTMSAVQQGDWTVAAKQTGEWKVGVTGEVAVNVKNSPQVGLSPGASVAVTNKDSTPLLVQEVVSGQQEPVDLLPVTGRTIGGPGSFALSGIDPDDEIRVFTTLAENVQLAACVTVLNTGTADIEVKAKIQHFVLKGEARTFCDAFGNSSFIDVVCDNTCSGVWRVDIAAFTP